MTQFPFIFLLRNPFHSGDFDSMREGCGARLGAYGHSFLTIVLLAREREALPKTGSIY